MQKGMILLFVLIGSGCAVNPPTLELKLSADVASDYWTGEGPKATLRVRQEFGAERRGFCEAEHISNLTDSSPETRINMLGCGMRIFLRKPKEN